VVSRKLDGRSRGYGPERAPDGSADIEAFPADALVAQSQVSDCPRRLGHVLQTSGQSRELASVANGRIRATSAPERAGTAVMSGHPAGTANGPGALLERGPTQPSYRRIRQASMALTPGSSPKRALASRLSMVRPV
jgi:hypothetical protein